MSGTLAIDAHVHLHRAESALDELRAASTRLTAGGRTGVAMLAERAGFDMFDALRPELVATEEPEALWLDEGRRMLLIAGRQIVSGEGLEILGLATPARIPDGAPAREIVARLGEADAIVVLPWGVGKWLGARGRIVDALLAERGAGRLFLGDNGSRPGFWRERRFDGASVLSGSDPLPLPGSAGMMGGFGSIVEGALSPDAPSASLKRLLRDRATAIRPFGAPAGLLRFVTDQARLRLAK